MSTWRPFGPGEDADPRPVGDSLARLSRRLGAGEAGVLRAVFARWEEVVGKAVADHARPVSLSGGSLVVEVDQPAWATQLGFLEADLLCRLEEAAGTSVASRIEVRVRGPGRRRGG